jgi:hypothetical protein
MASEIKEKEPLSDSEILKDIRTKPTVPVWPHYAWTHNCSRNKAYETARQGDAAEFLHFGGGEKRQMVRAITAPLPEAGHA